MLERKVSLVRCREICIADVIVALGSECLKCLNVILETVTCDITLVWFM